MKHKALVVHLLFTVIVLIGYCQKTTGQVQMQESKLETVSHETLKYVLYYPKDYDLNKKEKYPLMLFLHGGGESGDSLALVKRNGPLMLVDQQGKQFPFLILAPQNPHKDKWWDTKAIMELLNTVIADNRVDTNRIYLTGLSRGGGASWQLAVEYPKKFAALAVVCGMAPVPYAGWLDKNLPIWVFHGTADPLIPISGAIEMVNKLKGLGHEVKLTSYEGVGHNSWGRAYREPELYEWFMKQKKK